VQSKGVIKNALIRILTQMLVPHLDFC